jgi:hypothetical protein
MSESDARKGAYTNALKKAAGFVGPGRDAYRGTIDDDHVPTDEPASPPRMTTAPTIVPPPAEAPRSAASPSAASAHLIRNRLSSKQYAALRSLSRSAGYDERGFKDFVKTRYGVEAAYLSRGQASELIGALIDETNGAREAG